MVEGRHAGDDQAELELIHRRWVQTRNRRSDDPDYQDTWYDEQCGACRSWFPLAGVLGSDYGVCAEATSLFDGRVRFEHDGCDAFESAGRWTIPDDL